MVSEKVPSRWTTIEEELDAIQSNDANYDGIGQGVVEDIKDNKKEMGIIHKGTFFRCVV